MLYVLKWQIMGIDLKLFISNKISQLESWFSAAEYENSSRQP